MKTYTEMSELREYQKYLENEEKSAATVEKYLRDVRAFFVYLDHREITKNIVCAYKEALEGEYAVNSINSMIAAVNHYLQWKKLEHCMVKMLRTQRTIYCEAKEELTKAEYMRLLTAAKDKPQLLMLLQTIAGTGIRVSELKFFTVEAVKKGNIIVKCKNKLRTILIPSKLRKELLRYAKTQGIRDGMIFVTRNGRPVDRSDVWKRMKKLCEKADVLPSKVFPHNLRKLFARLFYRMEKDVAKLADLLGHSSISTTRIYIKSTGAEHLKKIERLGLVL